MTWAALFPGQGSIDAAALQWLDDESAADVSLFDAMSQAIGTAQWRQDLDDPSWRSINAVAQVLVCGLSLVAWRRLREVASAEPALVAGYSVGMLPALAAAGSITPLQAIDIAARRAACMDAAAGGQAQAMLSVRGPAHALQQACVAHGLSIAIRIAPQHLIVAGPAANLAAAQPRLEQMGIETREIDVRIASHTPAMATAVPCFADQLNDIAMGAAHLPIVGDLDGVATRAAARLRMSLAAQLSQTVRWDLCMQTIAERHVKRVLEVGPGAALARLWNRAHPEIPARAIGDFATWSEAAEWLVGA